MFFILSKILLFLLSPLWWILAFIAIGLLSKSAVRKKRAYIMALIIFLIFSNPLLFNTVTYNWQLNHPTIKTGQQYNAGILLSGMASFDKNEKGFFGVASDRFIQTLKLYNQKVIRKIIITGGSGSLVRPNLNEAAFLKQEFLANNVPDSNIIIETASRNTSENAIFTKRVVDSLQIKGPLVLITSASHMRRATACFKKSGINADIYPTSYEAKLTKITFTDFLPDLQVVIVWQRILKEIVGTYAYKFTGKA